MPQRPDAGILPTAPLLWQIARGAGHGWMIIFAGAALLYLVGAVSIVRGDSSPEIVTTDAWRILALQFLPFLAAGIAAARFFRMERLEIWRALPFTRRQLVLGELLVDLAMVTLAVVVTWIPVAGREGLAFPLASALFLSGVVARVTAPRQSLAPVVFCGLALLAVVLAAVMILWTRGNRRLDMILLPDAGAAWVMVAAVLAWAAVVRRDMSLELDVDAATEWNTPRQQLAPADRPTYGGALYLPGLRPRLPSMVLTWAFLGAVAAPVFHAAVAPVSTLSGPMMVFAVAGAVAPAVLVVLATNRGEFLLSRPVSRIRLATTLLALAVPLALLPPAVRALRTWNELSMFNLFDGALALALTGLALLLLPSMARFRSRARFWASRSAVIAGSAVCIVVLRRFTLPALGAPAIAGLAALAAALLLTAWHRLRHIELA